MLTIRLLKSRSVAAFRLLKSFPACTSVSGACGFFRKLTNVRFTFVFFRSCYIMLPPILQEVSEKNSLVVISGLNSGLP